LKDQGILLVLMPFGSDFSKLNGIYKINLD